MSREGQVALVLGVVALLAVIVVGLGAVGMTTTTTSSEGGVIPDPPADSSTGIVFDLRTYGGMQVFGLRLSAPTREVHVAMVVPPECVRRDNAGVEELRSDGICADLPAHGEVSGGGTTAGGGTLVFVRIEVSKGCYDTLALGDAWPSTARACAQD